MPSNRINLQPGDRVCIVPGLRKHSPTVRIPPTEVCQLLEPLADQPPDAVTIRRRKGEVLWVDWDMVVPAGRRT